MSDVNKLLEEAIKDIAKIDNTYVWWYHVLSYIG